MRKIGAVVYGAAAYAFFVVVFVYAVGFVEDVGVPKTIDAPAQAEPLAALAVDTLLLAVFAIQHSVMARPAFKRWWTRLVPGPVERSTYVLVSSLALALVFGAWRPFAPVVWEARGPVASAALRTASLAGWSLALVSTFLISHLDLFGLRQVWVHARGRPYRPLGFTVRLLYRFVRHPMMLGFLIAFWATPRMTAGHLLFAAVMTLYVLVGIRLEERDLLGALGEPYAAYRREVPMIVPAPTRPVPAAHPGEASSPR